MKTCFKCSRTLPLTEFYPHPRMADGHLGKCKECTKSDTKNRYSVLRNDAEWMKEARRKRRMLYESLPVEQRPYRLRSSAEKKRSISKYRERYPERRIAELAVTNAIQSGRLIRQACEVCGATKAQAHHDDYSKPLDVRWLCQRHHTEHHLAARGEIEVSA